MNTLYLLDMTTTKTIGLRRFILFMFLATLQLATFSQDRKDLIGGPMEDAHQLGVFNRNIVVMQSGKQIYFASFGKAAAKTNEKLNRQDRFNIGSIAKEFNALPS